MPRAAQCLEDLLALAAVAVPAVDVERLAGHGVERHHHDLGPDHLPRARDAGDRLGQPLLLRRAEQRAPGAVSASGHGTISWSLHACSSR